MDDGRANGKTKNNAGAREAELVGPALRRAGATLNRVVASCRDAARVHRIAAADLNADHERERCLEVARQHADHAEALQALAYDLHIETYGRGSLAGAARCAWLAFEAALRGTRDEALLAHCAKAESQLERAYATALDKQLPGALRDLLVRQRTAMAGQLHVATEPGATAGA